MSAEAKAAAPVERGGVLGLAGRYRVELGLTLSAVLGSLLVYLPFGSRMHDVYRFWDAPNYLTIAKTGYAISPQNPLLAYVYEPSYFLRHFPLYPLLVRLLSFLGYQRSLLVVSVLAGVAAVLIFHRLLRDVWQVPNAGWLAFVFLFLPPRFLLYRSTGATETLFIALVLGSILLFERSRVGGASVLGAFAVLTRISGLVLAPAFFLILLDRKKRRALAWTLLIPLALAAYFVYCASRTGNFLEYFSQHSDKMSEFIPFGFVSSFFKIGLYHQVEYFILLALIYAVGISRIRKFEVPFVYCIFSFVLHLFISTEDWSRYWLAMAPFALVLGYRDILDTKAVRWIFPGYLVMAYVYAWGTIPLNACRPDIYYTLMSHLGLLSELLR